MECQVTTVQHGTIPLTPELQRAVSLPDGTRVSLTVENDKIVVRALPLERDVLDAMQDLFKTADYSLEDDLMQMRKEEAEHSLRKYGC